ncbi:hypothetical protein TWF481_001440 [Arthrobotrys musiformis]|uniref:Uncharacterized protein n=1 Tax=Arthrobotrys musiformis TaxID=47236 RepID=A0AAV9WSV2_9PEZI
MKGSIAFLSLILLCAFPNCLNINNYKNEEAYRANGGSRRKCSSLYCGIQAEEDGVPAPQSLGFKRESSNRRLKRAGGDDPDIIMIDDEDEALDILTTLSPLEKRYVKEAYIRGAALLDKQMEILRNPDPVEDPKFEWNQLEKAVVIKKNIRGIPPDVGQALRLLEQNDVVKNPKSYVAVFRSALKNDGSSDYDSTVLRTYISTEETHMYFPWPGELPAGAMYRDWIYQCLFRGMHPTADNSQGEQMTSLEYITIDNVDSADTLAIMEAIEREWRGRDLKTILDKGLIFTAGDINLKLAKSSPDTVSYFKYVLLAILCGTRQVSPIVEMLSTFPNTFDHQQIAAVSYTIDKDSGTAILFLELGWPLRNRSPEISGPGQEFEPGRFIMQSAMGSSTSLIRHPSLPDIERTAYGLQFGSASTPEPTFSRFGMQYEDIGYRFSASGRENHLVFEGYITGPTYAQVLQDYPLKNVDQEIHHVIYAAWMRAAGQTALYEMTFASIHVQSRKIMTEIRNKRKPPGLSPAQWDNKIAVFEELDPSFQDVKLALSETHEGKILNNLLTDYGGNFGVLGISRIEFGIYTTPGSKKKKGKPFMLIGFATKARRRIGNLPARPALEGVGSDASDGEVADTDEVANPSAYSWKTDLPSWLPSSVSPGSIEEYAFQSAMRGAYLESIAQTHYRFLEDRTLPALVLQSLTSSYDFTVERGITVLEEMTASLLYLYTEYQRAGGRKAIHSGEFRFVLGMLSPTIAQRIGIWGPQGTSNDQRPEELLYDKVTVKRAKDNPQNENQGDERPQYTYDLVMSLALSHVVVDSVPEVGSDNVMELENVAFAAWHHLVRSREYVYPSEGPTATGDGCNNGPRYFSILNIRDSTRLLIEKIYERRSWQKAEVLMLAIPSLGQHRGHRLSTYKKMGKATTDDIKDFITLLGSLDVIGISRLASRYHGSQHLVCRVSLRYILVRWVDTPGGGGLRPELLVGLRQLYLSRRPTSDDPGSRSIWDLDLLASQKRALPKVILPAITGRVTTILSYLYIQPPEGTSDQLATGTTWSISTAGLTEQPNFPQRIAELIQRGEIYYYSYADPRVRSDRQHPNFAEHKCSQHRVQSMIEDRSYSFLVDEVPTMGSAGNIQIIIMQNSYTIAQDDQSGHHISELSEMYSTILTASIPNYVRLKSVRLVTFLEFSSRTKWIVKQLIHIAQTGADRKEPGRIKLRVSLHEYKGTPAAEENNEGWDKQLPIIRRIAWEILMGTPEISALALSLRQAGRHEKSIETIYIESSKDGSEVQGGVYLITERKIEAMNRGGDGAEGEEEEEGEEGEEEEDDD